MLEISDYAFHRTRTYRIDSRDIVRAGNDAVALLGERPSFRACCGLALVAATWRWRATYEPIENAARRAAYRRRVLLHREAYHS